MLRVRGERRVPNEILDNLVYPRKKSVAKLLLLLNETQKPITFAIIIIKMTDNNDTFP